MRTRPSPSRIYFTIISALVLALAGAVGTAIASTTRTSGVVKSSFGSRHFLLVTGSTGVKFLGEHRLPGGDYTASWRMYRHESVTVAGPSGSTVTVSAPVRAGHGGAFEITMTPPAIKDKSRVLIQPSARSRAAVAQDALAVGYTRQQAADLAASTVRNTTPAKSTAPAANSTPHSQAPIPPGTILMHWCVSGKGDGGYAPVKACEVQKMVQDKGHNNWYTGDEVTGSAEDTWPSDSLSDFQAYVKYVPGNKIIKWNPSGTSSVGCGNHSLSLGAFGFSFGVSFQTCTGTLGPYGLPSYTTFGGEWEGCDWQPVWEGDGSLDVAYSPASAGDAVSLHSWITWKIC